MFWGTNPDGRDSDTGLRLIKGLLSGAPDIGGRGNGRRVELLDLVLVGGGFWSIEAGSAFLGGSSRVLNSGVYALDIGRRSSAPVVEVLGANGCAGPG